MATNKNNLGKFSFAHGVAFWSLLTMVVVSVGSIGVTKANATVVASAGIDCQIPAASNRTIFYFPTSPRFWMVASGSQQEATAGPYSFNLSAGTYRLTLATYDDHSAHPGQYQPRESYKVVLSNGNNTVAVSGASADIPDNSDYVISEVNSNLSLSSAITSITAFHAAYFESGNPESLTPTCAAFDLIQSQNPPTVDVKVNNQDGVVTIPYGNSATLTWTSQNATSCALSGTYAESNFPLSGSRSGTATQAAVTYIVTCTGPGGTATDQAGFVTRKPEGVLMGRVIKDDNGNGIFDSGEFYIKDPSGPTCSNQSQLSGVRINYSGVQNGQVILNQCNPEPFYSVNLPPGQYSVSVNAPSGWHVTGDNFKTVTISDGQATHWWSAIDEDAQIKPPTVDIKANTSDGPITIAYNTSATLSWTSQNATSCTASSDWSGSRALNGSQSTGLLTSVKTYIITCIGPGGQVSDSVRVNVDNPPANAPTVDIKANNSDGPITIAYNTSATLSWTSQNANSCSASGDWSGSKTLAGTQSTGNLTLTKVYVITCAGPGGQVSDFVTINVQDNQQPPIVDIKANGSDGPITIDYNTSATLIWSSTNASSCTASGNWSGSKVLIGSQSTGTLTTGTYIYTIICINSVGQDSDSVTVNVRSQQSDQPTVNIKANNSDGPITIDYLQAATLSWVSANADSCVASGGPWTGSKPLNGSQSTGTLTTGTYNFAIQCTGVGGVVNDSVTVIVRSQQVNLPTVTLTANPANIISGNRSTLSWTSSNADSCFADGGPWSGNKPLNSSEQTTVLTQNTTFRITCTNSAGQASSDAVVTVGVGTISVTLTANPSTISQGGSSTLSWTSQNASYCYADGGPWYGNKQTNGSEPIYNLQTTRTFGITCVNSIGNSAHADTVITVNQNQLIPTVTIYASPNPVQSGTQSRLFWNSQNATSCYASGGPWTGTKLLSGDEYTSALSQATTFSITCSSSSGQTATQSVTVGVQTGGGGGGNTQPPVLNLYANPIQTNQGGYSTLTWNSTYADYCTASDGWQGNRNLNGSQQVGPLYATQQNYILTCYGPGGSVTRNATVSTIGQTLGAAAPILSIYATPSPIQYGGSSTVTWNAANVDSCWASNDWYGSKQISGSQPTGILYSDKTYTLTCVGLGGTITRSAVVPVILPTYVPPPTGIVQGVSGSYSGTINKTIENLTVSNGSGTQIGAWSGNELRYTITVSNTGTLTLTNLIVKDVLSDKVDIISASDNGVYDYTNRTVSWKFNLSPGATKVLTLTVRVNRCETDVVVENRATLDNGQINEVVSNTTVAGVSAGPVVVTIDNPSPIVRPGDKVIYTIHYRNDGQATVRGASLSVAVPAGMSIEGYTQTCSVAGNTVQLNIGDIASGQSGQVQVIGLVDKGVLDGEQLVMQATLDYKDGNGASRQSSAQTVSTVSRNGSSISVSANNSGAVASSSLRFLPHTFFGWLVLLLLIIALAILIRHLLTKNEKKEEKK